MIGDFIIMNRIKSNPRYFLNICKLPAMNPNVRVLYPSMSALNRSIPVKETHEMPIREEVFSSPASVPTDLETRDVNIRIDRLGRHGKVKQARKLFDEMPRRDVVSYATMINVYLKNNDLPQAEKLFFAMPEKSIIVESAMVDGYVKAGRLAEAQKLFEEMSERNVYSWTSLVAGYFTSGKVDEGRQLFDRMPVKNAFSWTTVVLGYARNGLIDQARQIFDVMPGKNTVSWTAMIKSYIENGRLDDAEKLFQEMPQKNLYTWNIMMSGFLQGNRVDEAIQLFSMMPQKNAVSWTTMVTGLARNGMTIHAREYFDLMPKKDIAAWNAMITAYVDAGLVLEAAELFDSMPERNVVTWNKLIDGYSSIGVRGEALKLLKSMLFSGFKPNETTITSALTSCEGMLELLQVHALIIPRGFKGDTPLTNSLITMYARSGDPRSARLAFENLKAKDVVSWTAMILAYSNHGYGHHALQVFSRMLRAGEKPDEITFVGILSACSHAGLAEKGQRLFDSMSNAYNLEPKAEHYTCLVDMLGRAGKVDEALEAVWKMPGYERDSAVLGALLSACRLHRDDRIADYVGEKLLELEPTMAGNGNYVLLANVYAANARWSEFALVRKRMKEWNVKKIAGFSQIEIKGRNHLFFAGDRSHPEKEEIYGFLQEKLIPAMQETARESNRSQTLCFS